MNADEGSVLQEVRRTYRKIKAAERDTDDLCGAVTALFRLMEKTPMVSCLHYLLSQGAMPVITDFLHDAKKEERCYDHGLYILTELIRADLDGGMVRTDDRAVVAAIDGLFVESTLRSVAKFLREVINKHCTFVCQLRDCGIETALFDLVLDMGEGDHYNELFQLAASLNEDPVSNELLQDDWADRKVFIEQILYIMKRRMQKGKDHDMSKTLQEWMPILEEAIKLDVKFSAQNQKIIALAVQLLVCFFSKTDHPYGDIVNDSGLAPTIVGLLTAPDEVAVEALRFISVSASNEELCKEYNQDQTYQCLRDLLTQRDSDKVRAGVCCALRGIAASINGEKFEAHFDLIRDVLTALQANTSKHVNESLMLFLTEVLPQLQNDELVLRLTRFLFQKLLVAFTTDSKCFALNNLTKCLKRLKRVDRDVLVKVVVHDLTERLCQDPNQAVRHTAGKLLYSLMCVLPTRSG